jgi:hypothetical protein
MDTQKLLEKIDLMALAEQAGARFNNNRSSRCPLHGGDNRSAFHVYQRDGIQRWHCFTRCQDGSNDGDAIKFYMLWRGCDFKQAVTDLANMAGIMVDDVAGTTRHERRDESLIEPDRAAPSQLWQKRAREFCDYARVQLSQSQRALDYLHDKRGLSDVTIAAFGLGFNPRALHDSAARWGLADGNVYLARGIVIPHWHGDLPWFVTVRRAEGEPKYLGVRGGVRCLFGKQDSLPVTLLCEGEFDAMLTWQGAGDLCNVATLCGARQRLCLSDVARLMTARVIIDFHDDDTAGALGAAYMRRVFGDALRRYIPPAHDLTDYWRAGGDLRAYIADVIRGEYGQAV